ELVPRRGQADGVRGALAPDATLVRPRPRHDHPRGGRHAPRVARRGKGHGLRDAMTNGPGVRSGAVVFASVRRSRWATGGILSHAETQRAAAGPSCRCGYAGTAECTE